MGEVKIQPDIALSSFQRHDANLLRTWLLLRSLDPDGKGRVDLRDLFAAEAGRRHRTTVMRILKKGEGIYWYLDTKGDGSTSIRYVGMQKLFIKFNLPFTVQFVHRSVILPDSIFDSKIAQFRAQMYSLCFTITQSRFEQGKINAPISRATIRKLVGPCERTQLRYDKKADIKKQFNYAPHEARQVTVGYELPYEMKGKFFIGRYNKSYCLIEHLPNDYNKIVSYAPLGQVIHLVKLVKSVKESRCNPSAWDNPKTSSHKSKRIYYFDATKLGKRDARPDRISLAYCIHEQKKSHNLWRPSHPLWDTVMQQQKNKASETKV